MTTVRFDMVQTLALAAVVLFLGYAIRRRIALLQRFAIPAAVVGGFVFAGLALALRQAGVISVQLDTTLQSPLIHAWFTTIGLGAGIGLLTKQARVFAALAGLLALIQNGVGWSLAAAFGVDPLVGMLSASISLTGGHGIGAAFGTLMEEQVQLEGAVTMTMAAATLGLVAGILLGSSLAAWLVRRRWLVPASGPAAATPDDATPAHEEHAGQAGQTAGAYRMLTTITLILVLMWAGVMVSDWFAGRGIRVPGFVAAMLAAVVVRNGADRTRGLGINLRAVEDLGAIALSLFLVMAVMLFEPGDLRGLELFLAVILVAQVMVTALFACLITFRTMGRDYDAAVMAAGQSGLGLGAMPAATAAMAATVRRFGAAPRAFLIVSAAGACFIDVTNGIIITTYLNLVR
jgi:ESS family glutamate:Na+ symporter